MSSPTKILVGIRPRHPRRGWRLWSIWYDTNIINTNTSCIIIIVNTNDNMIPMVYVRSGCLGCGGKIGFISRLVVNAAVWFLACPQFRTDYAYVRSSGSQNFLADSWLGNLNFRRDNNFRFRWSSYFRKSYETAAFLCTWPSDRGRGRIYAICLARTRHHGCRIGFPGW